MIHFQFTNILKYSGLHTPLQQVYLLDTTWYVANFEDVEILMENSSLLESFPSM